MTIQKNTLCYGIQDQFVYQHKASQDKIYGGSIEEGNWPKLIRTKEMY